MQTTGRQKREPALATARNEEQTTALKRRIAGAALACDHVLHGLGRSVFILSPLIILAVLVLGLGYVRLRHGPISLTFMVAPIERGINAELNGGSVRIDDALVSLSETGGLEFRLSNLRIREPDGDIVASAPLAAVQTARPRGLGAQARQRRGGRGHVVVPVRGGGVARAYGQLVTLNDDLLDGRQ